MEVPKKERKQITRRDVELSIEQEPVILVGGYRKGELMSGEEPLSELERLAETANARIVGKVVQKLDRIHPGTYIGKGKVYEVKELAERTQAQAILFDHDLMPSQSRELEKITGLKVMDRTELILDIFASHARTHIAKVQVNLALCHYRLPRLRRLWTHLEKQRGGIGMRAGPGEKQIETDRRKVLKQIADLTEELQQIEARKERTVQARKKEHFLISLVGYTNAGKSTLMRALTGEDVLVEDKLFATLDTRTAVLKLGNGLQALLSDTVGFIRRLPHRLVASFHATLEEARNADLLLHVVDASSATAREQLEAVNIVLKEIGCHERPTLLVFNKIDAVPLGLELESRFLSTEFPSSVRVSALKETGFDLLRQEILKYARTSSLPVELMVHVGDGKSLAFIATHFFQSEKRVEDEWIYFKGHATRAVLDHLAARGESVRILSGWKHPEPAWPEKKETPAVLLD